MIKPVRQRQTDYLFFHIGVVREYILYVYFEGEGQIYQSYMKCFLLMCGGEVLTGEIGFRVKRLGLGWAVWRGWG